MSTLGEPKILIWDIETTNLVANIGNVLCIGYKWLGDKQTTIMSIRDYPVQLKADCTDDRRLVKDFSKVMEQADSQVTWYGKKFDYRFINTRLLYHDLPPLPPVKHFDGWEVARYKLKLHSNRLQVVQDFLDLPVSKTPLSFRELARSRSGHIPSLKSIEEHCYADVEVLEQAYLKIRPYAGEKHFNATLVSDDNDKCPTCGSKNIHRRGLHMAITRLYQRWKCSNCGRWFRSLKSYKSTVKYR